MEEKLSEFLERRRREVENRLAAAKAAVTEFELELEQLRTVLSVIRSPGELQAFPSEDDGNGFVAVRGGDFNPQGIAASGAGGPSPDLSIRALILSAFRSKPEFRRYGATNSDLRQFVKDTTGREIDRSSLSPALSRLRNDGLLISVGDSKWKPAQGLADGERTDGG